MSDHDPTDIRAQRARTEAQSADAQRRALLEKNDLLWLMGEPRGRRFVWRLLERSGVFRSSFTGNSQTFFNEGARSVGLWAQAICLEFCPEDYLKMLLEKKGYET